MIGDILRGSLWIKISLSGLIQAIDPHLALLLWMFRLTDNVNLRGP